MSLGKLPGMKSLMSGSQGRRPFKSDLSVDMISSPLGDFRHTMHVGRGGDVFGDTSFLSNYGGVAAGDGSSGGFFSRTLRHVRKTPSRPRCGSRELSPPPPPISPIIKNAISLPQLNLGGSNGCLQRVLFPNSPGSTYGMQSGFLTLPRPSRTDREPPPSSNTYTAELHYESISDCAGLPLARSDSLTSFTVDLGPSLMSEVFALIDNPACDLGANHSWMGEELEVSPRPTASGTAVTASTMELGLLKDWNGRRSPDIQGCLEEGGSPEMAMADVGAGHSVWQEPAMEPEKFQKAADVLDHHYGGRRLLKCLQTEDNPGGDSRVITQKRAPYAYPEEEDEIKV
ncbi:cdc42 effector protein 1-like [Paramormyrops kingsleyae]|uniref:CDC42 effector protein (Rho GTPase binding) 1b n=1 Tax=Paramormyrops kingsleyae TaxID=1676925 RepID=A0A3B3S3B4_9TELE|nr:cdc42 effector protein 1-like [Paramormyrops kingsleyae]